MRKILYTIAVMLVSVASYGQWSLTISGYSATMIYPHNKWTIDRVVGYKIDSTITKMKIVTIYGVNQVESFQLSQLTSFNGGAVSLSAIISSLDSITASNTMIPTVDSVFQVNDTIDYEYYTDCYRSKLDSGVYKFNVVFDPENIGQPVFMNLVDADSLQEKFKADFINGVFVGSFPDFSADYIPCERWDELTKPKYNINEIVDLINGGYSLSAGEYHPYTIIGITGDYEVTEGNTVSLIPAGVTITKTATTLFENAIIVQTTGRVIINTIR